MSATHAEPRTSLTASILSILLLGFSTGCASSSNALVSTTPDLIEAAELTQYRSSGITDAYELVQRARPRWLESRGERSVNLDTGILVYLNRSRLGDLDSLRGLRIDNIVRIRRLDSARAGQLPGATGQHVESAIVLETAGGSS